MFFKIVFLVCFVASAFALPPPPSEPVAIVSQEAEVNPDGSFQWSYQSGDGTSQQESGELKQLGHDAGQIAKGSVSWTDPEGGEHQLSYVADENGYQPNSADLPVGPEIPSHIVKALEWIAAHPPKEN